MKYVTFSSLSYLTADASKRKSLFSTCILATFLISQELALPKKYISSFYPSELIMP
jgi:hypothetical protein